MINLKKPISILKSKIANIDEEKIDRMWVKVQTKIVDIKNKLIKSLKNFTNL